VHTSNPLRQGHTAPSESSSPRLYLSELFGAGYVLDRFFVTHHLGKWESALWGDAALGMRSREQPIAWTFSSVSILLSSSGTAQYALATAWITVKRDEMMEVVRRARSTSRLKQPSFYCLMAGQLYPFLFSPAVCKLVVGHCSVELVSPVYSITLHHITVFYRSCKGRSWILQSAKG
jgi:hypothetical protein